MKEKNKKSHLAGYVDAMMKIKADEFHDNTIFADERSQEIRNKITLVKPLDSNLSIGIPNGDPIVEALGQPLGDSTGEAIDTPSDSPIKELVKESIDQSIGKSMDEVTNGPDRQAEIGLNHTQYLLYCCIKGIGERLTNLVRISRETGIPRDTLKSALKRLKEKNAILYHGRGNTLGLHGFSAKALYCSIHLVGTDIDKINRQLRGINFETMCIDGRRLCDTQNHLFNHPMLHQLDHPSADSSSIFNISNKLLQEIEVYFEYDPDFVFWKNEKLNSQTIARWINEFHISINDMMLYLSRCCYDLLNSKKGSLNKSPIEYFYGCIRRNKAYFSPKGYLSIDERKVADIRQKVEEKEYIARQLKELEERQRKAELEIQFAEIMANESSDIYQKCLNDIPIIFRNEKSSIGFKTEMKKAFEKICNQ